MNNREAIEAIKTICPGFDAPLLSKARNPDKYGIELTASARSLVESRRSDRRSKPCRYTMRLSESASAQLQRAFREDGFDTKQAGLEWLVEMYLKGRE